MKKNLIILCSMVTSLLFLCGCIDDTSSVDPMVIYVNDDGGADYVTIQDAINSLPENYSIFVYSGIYNENIIINSTVDITGEDVITTIVNGNSSGDTIYITENGKANISNLTIKNFINNSYKNFNAGIDIRSNHNNITNNIISNNEYGIYSTFTQFNNFSKNIITNNSEYGIYLYTSCNNNMIFDNVFSNNSCGLRIKGSRYNNITKNLFSYNQKGMFFCCGARYNIAFNNIFFNNSFWNADDQVGNNQWDNGIIGNYWDDYYGLDADGNGIGDIPYSEFSNGKDNYPLINKIYYSI